MASGSFWAMFTSVNIAPIVVALLLHRRDLCFMLVQFLVNILFESIATGFTDEHYFKLAVVLNLALALYGAKYNGMYVLVFVGSALFCLLRLLNLADFSGGYFTMLTNLILCIAMVTRVLRKERL